MAGVSGRGAGEDEILAVDRVSGATTSTFWTLADRQGTVRDIVSGNAADRRKVVEHRQYDSFGKLVRRTTSPAAGSPVTAGVGIEFGYAGRPLEERTGLSDNRARWYEPGTGRFINEDPSGFKGGDANLFRYVGNDPLDRIDPSGLMAKWAQPASRASAPATGWAGLGMAGVTAAGGSSRQSSTQAPMPTAMPTYSLSSPNASAPRTAAVSSQPSLRSQPFASLVTTGRAAPAAPMQSRWTLQDREAALRSEMAYAFSQGGLLKDLNVDYGGDNATNKYTSTGMSAMLTRSPVTGTYYLAFRGTEIGPIDPRDADADLSQYAGRRTSQYEKAIELAQLVKERLGPDAEIHVTGHSLGGGLAAAAAYATGLKATVFNPASLSRRYAQGTPGEIRSHVIVGDPLSIGRTVQNTIFGPNYWMGAQGSESCCRLGSRPREPLFFILRVR